MKRKIKLGIIGCGAIGSEIARGCVNLLGDKIELRALYDTEREKSLRLSGSLGKNIAVNSAEELFDIADLVVESACGEAARDALQKAIEKAKDVMIMSVGGLLGSVGLLERAEKKGIRVYLPSGAICGIDGLKGAGLSKVTAVTLTTRKPPKGLCGAPYLKEKGIDIDSIKEETVIFEGNAHDAVRGFPKNVNVASLLSLAGVGATKTTVRIVTSPAYTKNAHEVKITGDFGEITTRTENVPSEKNPKTSRLAYLSAIATLKGIVESVRIGT